MECFFKKEKIIEHTANIKEKKFTKATGAIVAEVFRKNIEYVLQKNHLENDYKVSENNVYIAGCHIEFDFLILKKSAKRIEAFPLKDYDSNIKFELPIYNAEDVVAVLESKTYGIYSLYKGRDGDTETQLQKNDLYRFVTAYNDILKRSNPEIKIGYMCLAEQRPNQGVSNFIEKTIYFFEDFFGNKYADNTKNWHVYYAKCQYTSKTADVYASDDDWEKFVINLVQ